jgi:hypothetical protein
MQHFQSSFKVTEINKYICKLTMLVAVSAAMVVVFIVCASVHIHKHQFVNR